MGKMQRRTDVRGRGGTARVRGRWEREWCVGKMGKRVACGENGKESWCKEKIGRRAA